MCYLSIKSLPEVCFAHIFGAENYKNTLYPRQDEIEVSYVSEGSLTVCHENQFYTVNQGDFACFFHWNADVVSSDTFHEHHTVCFNMQFELTDVKVKNSLVLPVYIGSIYNGDVCRKLIDDIIKTHTICPDDGMKCTVLFLQLLNELNYGVAGESRQQSSGMSLYVHKCKKIYL